MTDNSTVTLRAGLNLLAEQAPAVDALDHSAWGGRASSRPGGRRPSRPGGRRPRRRLQLTAIASTVAVVAALVVGSQVIHHRQGRTPAASGQVVLEVRPLVALAVPVANSGTLSADPLQALPFPIPSTAAEYGRLSAVDQQQLLTAFATTDCTHPSASAATARVACGSEISGRRDAYLLGPALFGNDQIKSAEAVAPSVSLGETEWTVSLELRAPAAAAFARYTTAHHTSGPDAAYVMQCGVGSTACGDYLGFVVDGSVVSIPLTAAPISGGAIQMTGNFDKQSADTLAHQLHP